MFPYQFAKLETCSYDLKLKYNFDVAIYALPSQKILSISECSISLHISVYVTYLTINFYAVKVLGLAV